MSGPSDQPAEPAVTVSRRAKYLTLLGLVVGSGLVLIASTQPWFVVHLTDVGEHSATLAVTGAAAAPALTALSLAGLALAAALAIAGPVFRLVLAALGVLLGVSVLVSAGSALGDVLHASSTTITSSTGVAGTASIDRLVNRVDTAVWPWIAVAGGVILVLGAVTVFVTSRVWPGPSRRYQTRFEELPGAADDAAAVDVDAATAEDAEPSQDAAETAAEAPDTEGPRTIERDQAIDSWDELSRGEDPTR